MLGCPVKFQTCTLNGCITIPTSEIKKVATSTVATQLQNITLQLPHIAQHSNSVSRQSGS